MPNGAPVTRSSESWSVLGYLAKGDVDRRKQRAFALLTWYGGAAARFSAETFLGALLLLRYGVLLYGCVGDRWWA